MNKLPCEVVKDLLPSYIEGLTSEVTGDLVKEHVTKCVNCKNVLEAMKEPAAPPVSTEDKKEIDFLKKNRKRNKSIICGSVIFALLIILVVAFVKNFLVGRHAFDEMMAWEMSVDGKHMVLDVMVGSGNGVSYVGFEESDGVVKVSVEYVKRSPFYSKSDVRSEYEAREEIRQIWIDDRIVWSDGERISALASAVYNTGHAYVGDMPANSRTANVLDMVGYLGSFGNELQTTTEPYGWKMNLTEEISAEDQAYKEAMMQSYACVLIAVIENLGEVSYEYRVDGETYNLSVNEEKACELAGMDIKECGKEVLLLQKLLEKTGIDRLVYISEADAEVMQEDINIEIVNWSDTEIASYAITYYLDGEVCGTMVGMNADESMVEKGELLEFIFLPEDFIDERWDDEKEFVAEIKICDKNGNEYTVEKPLRVGINFWTKYQFELHGSPEEGFTLEQ